MKNELFQLQKEITMCRKCNRLNDHCQNIAQVKRKSFQNEVYWGKPVPSFGDPQARIWIIGLAPAAHGANRTGRMFTGDQSGVWLYRALYKAGLSNRPSSENKEDQLKLNGVFISASAHCAPPENKPTKEELDACFPYLEREKSLLSKVEVVVCLGKLAFDQTLKLFPPVRPKPTFGHTKYYKISNTWIVASYHPSQQNTFTGVLTEPAFDQVFRLAKELHI